jgi:hypothetical protein
VHALIDVHTRLTISGNHFIGHDWWLGMPIARPGMPGPRRTALRVKNPEPHLLVNLCSLLGII